jgi:hypothetical protein
MPDSPIADALRPVLRKRGVAICLSGIDGSGKTTLAQQLVGSLTRAGVPARHLHVYQWYLNLLAMPLLLLYNRYIGRKVLVLDRSYFDNVAVLALWPGCPEWLPHGVLRVMLTAYPRFDYCFHLVADLDETVRRRPETHAHRFAVLSSAYDWVTRSAGHTRLHSDEKLFGEVQRSIVNRNWNTGFPTEHE